MYYYPNLIVSNLFYCTCTIRADVSAPYACLSCSLAFLLLYVVFLSKYMMMMMMMNTPQTSRLQIVGRKGFCNVVLRKILFCLLEWKLRSLCTLKIIHWFYWSSSLASKEFIFSRPEKAFCSITFDEMVNINRKSLCGNRTVTHVFFTLLLAKNVHCSTKRQVFFRYLD